MTRSNLLGPPPVHLPRDAAADDIGAGASAESAARDHPESSLAWALLAEHALDAGREVQAYAYARVGYHRGLDSLRRNGWKGAGPIPWSHEPNQAFLRALSALGQAAAAIEEVAEVERIRAFLLDADPQIPAQMLP